MLDMGVLVFNYYTSRLIEADAARIGTAGELRMYSQQLAKAVLSLGYELRSGKPSQTSLAQISESHAAFEDSLRHLDEGLKEAAQETFAPKEIAEAMEGLAAIHKTWEPLGRETALLPINPNLKAEDVESAASQVFNRNVKLMQQAGDLTATLENSAVQRASSMRQIQLVAIILACLNFIFIVFKFVRSLRASDRLTEAARQETSRILENVQEGLFLMDREGRLGLQSSASLAGLLGQTIAPGDNIYTLLEERLDTAHRESARDFIGLLFNKKVKPSLLKQLNPLREVAFARPDGKDCYLDFEFEQVQGGDAVEQLLVTVFDVTRKVVLERELATAQQRAKTEVDALLAVLEQDPANVDHFLRQTEARLAEINTELANVEASPMAYSRLINRLAREVHGIKGEAATLGLTTIESEVHAFESVLSGLRGRKDLSGDDLIPLAVAMNDLHEATAKVWGVIERVQNFARGKQSGSKAARQELRELLDQIEHLTLRVANDLGKKAKIQFTAPTGISLPASLLDFLRSTLPQLVRNAVAHGIEPAEQRQSKGKPHEGVIHCRIEIEDDGALHVTVEDDGCGLSPQALRQSLVEKGVATAEEVAAMSDKQVVAMIFEPGFSALEEAGLHAGRGDGLSVVKEAVARWGGKLRIASQPSNFTRFILRLEKESWQCA